MINTARAIDTRTIITAAQIARIEAIAATLALTELDVYFFCLTLFGWPLPSLTRTEAAKLIAELDARKGSSDAGQ